MGNKLPSIRQHKHSLDRCDSCGRRSARKGKKVKQYRGGVELHDSECYHFGNENKTDDYEDVDNNRRGNSDHLPYQPAVVTHGEDLSDANSQVVEYCPSQSHTTIRHDENQSDTERQLNGDIPSHSATVSHEGAQQQQQPVSHDDNQQATRNEQEHGDSNDETTQAVGRSTELPYPRDPVNYKSLSPADESNSYLCLPGNVLDNTEPRQLTLEAPPNLPSDQPVVLQAQTLSPTCVSECEMQVPSSLVKKLTCVFFARYHQMNGSGLLKVTTGFVERGIEAHIQELRQNSEAMWFGRQVQKECHYLYESRGDLKMYVTDLGEEWQANGRQSQDTLVQTVQYDKLWDGVVPMCSFHFKTQDHSRQKLFNATFNIQQQECLEKTTTFTLCEPIYFFEAAHHNAPISREEDVSSVEVVSSSSSEAGVL